MGIRLRNLDEAILDCFVPGNASAGVKFRAVVPFRCEVSNIFANLGTAGITGNMITDVNRRPAGGASATIFSTATKITFATTATVATYSAVLAAQKVFEAGDEIEVEIDSIHTTPAVGLHVMVLFQKRSAPDVVTNQHPSALLPAA